MSFRLTTAIYQGRCIPLSINNSNDTTNQNYCTILIGRNGTGKSRLLAEICRAFESFDSNGRLLRKRSRSGKSIGDNYKDLHIFYQNCQHKVELIFDNRKIHRAVVDEIVVDGTSGTNPPSRVIATTITPFDKFPVGRRRFAPTTYNNDDRASIYRYLGSKNNVGQLSSTGQLSRVIESLMFASEKNRVELVRLKKVFDFLGYYPIISVDYEIRFKKYDAQQWSLFRQGKYSVNELINLLGSDSRRRYAFDSEISKNPAFVEELFEALSAVVNSGLNGRICTIGLDFESGIFKSGSLDIFKHVLFLRKYGLLSLSDLRMVKSQGNDEISIRDASSGEQAVVLTFLGIASEIEDSSLIIIDEPEISLHPEWQERFIELLNSTFNGYQGCHFILATHSPLLLSKVEGDNCSVVTMDDLSISPATEFSKKSADYQLAEAFGTPGYRNEYLAREGLAALRLASHRKYNSTEFKEKIAMLSRLRPQLQDDDPVAQMTDALVAASREVSR